MRPAAAASSSASSTRSTRGRDAGGGPRPRARGGSVHRPGHLGTTDDCGFSPFGDDTSTSRDTAFAKIRARIDGTAWRRASWESEPWHATKSASCPLTARAHRRRAAGCARHPGRDPADTGPRRPPARPCRRVARQRLPGRHAPRHEREMLATAVSAANDCFYCMDSHGAFANALLERNGATDSCRSST